MKNSLMIAATAFALMTTATYIVKAEKLDLVDSSNGCRKFASVEDAILEPFMRWLSGYRDGVAALAVLDKRLGNLPRDTYLLGALVLSSCHAKPDRSIGEVANETFEMFINREPGQRLKLGVAMPPGMNSK
jgi:hypothetical protein